MALFVAPTTPREDEDLSALSEDHAGLVKPDDGRVLRVDVYMHVVGRPEADDSSEFPVTCETLTKQVDVLNKSFKPANISLTTRHRLLVK
ncbi:uncharacterized protein G6M90_00g050700 [Metarhizium brunneum]|uniref:Uncharacterized protein n=1 Tax=Metarhizium brunneum TaxID=500148 RepID=A0A7D5UUZ5_9HYPO|nr:hypothetical protein G6M90_00g050700 [Metarhizium brunneum]